MFGQRPDSTDTPADAPSQILVEVPAEGPGSASWWWSQIEAAEKIRKKFEPTWKENLRRYKGQRHGLDSYGVPGAETITPNVDFANTEQKKAQLFYQSPELQLAARRREDVPAQALAQAVINQTLAHDIPVMAMVDEVLMDLVCPSGIGFSKIGYTAHLGAPIPQPKQQPVTDPQTGAVTMRPAVDPVTGQAAVEMVPNILREVFSWDRFSPMKGIIPDEFDGTDYDDAPWLGMRFQGSAEECKEAYGFLPKVSRVDTDSYRLTDDRDREGNGQRMYDAVEIWYRSAYLREEIADPEHFTQLVLACGRGNAKAGAEVLVHRDSPYQTVDGRGVVTGGMRGNPIHVFTLRYTSDSAWPASDCSMSRNAVIELSLARSQMCMQRRRNLPMRWQNIAADPDAKGTAERLQKADTGSLIPLRGNGNELLGVLSPANLPQENWRGMDVIERDIAKIWALGANQNGAPMDAGTATEAQIMQQNTETRMARERDKFLRTYVRGAEKVFALLQKFASTDRLVEILGKDGAAILTQWNKDNIQGVFRFTARPDSSIRVDAAQDFERFLRFYNLTANDPNFNRVELDIALAQKANLDPVRFVITQPPAKAPEKPKVSLTFNGDDMNAALPQFPVVAAILEDAGMKIPDQSKTTSGIQGVMSEQQQAQREQIIHPGHVKQVETLDQHAADRTGQRSGPRVAETVGA